MSVENRPITSREYKLMLKPELFLDRARAVNTFRHLAATLVKREKGTFKDQGKEPPKKRRTWYVDTEGGDLNQNNLVLRVRKEGKRFRVTLKYRIGDRYLSAMSQVRANKKKAIDHKKECKFEEDITPAYVSKFSRSCSLGLRKEPSLATLHDAKLLFPDLGRMLKHLSGATPLKIVNQFKAREYCHYLLTATFGGKQGKAFPVKMCMSFWYFKQKQQGFPLAAEFSYDFGHDKPLKANILETFPEPVLKACNGIFKSMLNMDAWIKRDGTTKTALAYDGV